jgi:hypothetical protein
MTDIQLERLWATTGCVPLLLHEYVKIHLEMHSADSTASYASVWNAFMHREGYKVFQQLQEFIHHGDVSDYDRVERLSVFSQFLTRSRPTGTVKNIDHRWFFKAEMTSSLYEAGRGYPLCGLAEQNASVLLHKERRFDHTLWLNACRESDNPSVQGFLAEQLVIHAVHTKGFELQDEKKTQTKFEPQRQPMVIFQTGDEHRSVHTDSLSYVYSPHAFNYNYIDLLVNQHVTRSRAKKVALAAFQVTFKTIAAHKESLDFFSSQYRLNWEKGYPGKSIEWHFVWVVREDEAIKKRDEYPQRIKYGTTPVTVHVRSFKEMSAELDFL